MGNSQSQPTKSTPLGCLLQNLKTLGFQGEIRPTLLTYHSNTVWPQSQLDIRFQWPENGILHSSSLRDLYNFGCCNGKWSEIPYVQAFFAFHPWPSLCTSCSTSQILLAYPGPLPPITTSPDPCLDFSSSSFDPSDHSAPPIASKPTIADLVPQPPP